MKIKEVQAGVKISQNYDSYQISLTADLEMGESPDKVGEELMEKALEIVGKKVKEVGCQKSKVKSRKPDAGNQMLEVGAAWPHKKSNVLLSVKMNEGGDWEHIKILDLEKVGEGYKQETNEGVFIFRKIPEGKRKNNKMPVFRIYKLEEENK